VSTEVILFLLRLISGLLILSFLVALFVIIWRDYHGTIQQLDATRRIYGQLVGIREIDGERVATGEVFPLLPLTSLGRSPTNSIIINDSFASSEHAVVALRHGQWWREDRNSRNGTTLNGLPVTEPVIVTQDDLIGIGTMRFRFELER
jgi:hypothetical protein